MSTAKRRRVIAGNWKMYKTQADTQTFFARFNPMVADAADAVRNATDAKAEPNVKVVGIFPEASHPPIVYPVALTMTAKADAAQYLAFLRSQAAKTVFEVYGFTFLPRPAS